MILGSPKALLLASGGADSTTLAYWLVDQNISFIPVFLNYGQHCFETELRSLRSNLPSKVLPQLELIDISAVYRSSSSLLIKEADLWSDAVSKNSLYVPYRNLLFLTVGAALAQSRGVRDIYTAFINSNHAVELDCSQTFFDNLDGLLAEIGSVTIKMPFRNMNKKEVLRLGLKLNAPVALTYSCQVSSANPCGACPNCVERLEAFSDILVESGKHEPST